MDLPLQNELPQQDHIEAKWFQDEIRGARSLLEIGSFRGESLKLWAAALSPGALIRSVDVCRPDNYSDQQAHDVLLDLRYTINLLNHDGFDAKFLQADSRSFKAINWAQEWAPYDVIFIDGGHSYPTVRGDFDCYGPMGRRVAFHDIGIPVTGSEDARVGSCPDVSRLWNEIRAYYPTKEFAVSGMGIGIVYMRE